MAKLFFACIIKINLFGPWTFPLRIKLTSLTDSNEIGCTYVDVILRDDLNSLYV